MSELRQDITSGDWVIIAPGRAARPAFSVKKKKRPSTPVRACPFEDLEKAGNGPVIAAYPNEKKWQIVLIPNKYPALNCGKEPSCAVPLARGIYRAKTGAGCHDLVITRDHRKNFSEVAPAMAVKIFEMFRARHRVMAKDPCNAYVATFCNWGLSVGASIGHPHYQILALPIIPPHIARSLAGSKAYYRAHRRCVRCDMIREERAYKKRIVAENDHAVALAPFASKNPFEVAIFPKRHLAAFGETPDAVLRAMALLLQSTLQRLKKYAGDPDFNFFIHGAPLDHGKYSYHHWHIEVVPRISVFGGFEYSTEIDINIADPDAAAAILKGRE